ncbi:glycosyltransferase family 4 protein [Larkinella soli]|uniref:glycosyltransferase family 4 protein n=1 Tax=Larkinella soli TaxID=1770527 RepID=UPI000FFC3BAF|nr:glycosyltransferase family 1 protein [Larkinella soli]
MKVILIGNYPLDRLESMERFAQMLHAGLTEAGIESEIWRPRVFFASRLKSTGSGLGKWIGYLDKWLIFPVLLRLRRMNGRLKKTEVRFHVCDHSNAPYLAHLPAGQTSITCHDVIAIRGALGHQDAYATPTWGTGMIYQKWIFHHLGRARRIAAVSRFTYDQLDELARREAIERGEWQVIHNAFNAEFGPVADPERGELLKRVGIPPEASFLLHVGSRHARKNRKLLLDMAASLGSRWAGKICFAGQPVEESLMAHARSLGLEDRVIQVIKPDHRTLQALYTSCEAFVFPSFSEGFGWPVIEAQACGTPVIASTIAPLMEVSGGSALHADPADPTTFADAFLSLSDEKYREEVIRSGLANCERFRLNRMIRSYLKLFRIEVPELQYERPA